MTPTFASGTSHSAEATAADHACAHLANGSPVIVVDDVRRAGESILMLAASSVTTESVARMVRYSSGFLCVAMPHDHGERLRIHPMPCAPDEPFGTRYCVSVDSVGTTTGISATDRALTARRLADPSATHTEFLRPGHVMSVLASPGGMHERQGRTETVVELLRMAQLPPVGVYAEIVGDSDGSVLTGAELSSFARQQGLPLVCLSQIRALWNDRS